VVKEVLDSVEQGQQNYFYPRDLRDWKKCDCLNIANKLGKNLGCCSWKKICKHNNKKDYEK